MMDGLGSAAARKVYRPRSLLHKTGAPAGLAAPQRGAGFAEAV
jgi:hypothetical protein